MKHFLSLILVVLVSVSAFSQCNFNFSQNVIINEIGSYVTVTDNDRVNDEYIEILVLGDPERPFTPVDLYGLIIDDNNASFVGVGNEPGHIKLGSAFSAIEPGSLILIYNPLGSMVDPANDGMPNSNGVYQLPITSNDLRHCEGNPSNYNNDLGIPLDFYSQGCGNPHRGITWDEFLPFRNFGDVAQVRAKNGDQIHSLAWHVDDPIPFPSQSIVFNNTILKNSSIQLIGNNYSAKDNYDVTTTGTPGLPNNEVNGEFIEKLLNGLNQPELIVEIIQNASDGEANGIVEVSLNGPVDYDFEYLDLYLNNELFVIQGLVFPFQIDNLLAGEHLIKVVEAYDQCFEFQTTVVLVEEQEVVTEVCPGECVMLNSDNIDPNLLAETPCIKWVNYDGEIISSEEEVEICPEGNELITQYIENENELTEVIVYHYVNEVNMSFSVQEIIPDECPPPYIEVELTGENIENLEWPDGTSDNPKRITSGGEYMVILTSPNGCVIESVVYVSNDIFIDSDGDGICDDNDCNPFVAYSGGVGTPCDDSDASTINDTYDENCNCVGEIDEAHPCFPDGDIDGDGVCDSEDSNPFDACSPNGTDIDGDGLCSNIDCDDQDDQIDYAIGNDCDDGNASTINDKIDENCECNGINDPTNPCNGQDLDGDGICDENDQFPEDECNGLSVLFEGYSFCLGVIEKEMIVTVSGGEEPYQIEWSDGSVGNAIMADISQESDYSITVTDANDCSIVQSQELIQYQEPDSDGDGICDDQSCGSEFDLSGASSLQGIIAPREVPPTLNNNVDDQLKVVNTLDCNMECDPFFGPTVCVKDFVAVAYTSQNECIEDYSAINEIVNGLNQVVEALDQPTLVKVFITTDDIICSCPNLEELYNRSWDIDPPCSSNEIYFWINFTEYDDIVNAKYKVKSCGYDDSVFTPASIISTQNVSIPFSNEGNIHPSQLQEFWPVSGMAHDDSEELLSDYAGLSEEARRNILHNIKMAGPVADGGRWGYDMHIITSSSCKSIPGPDGPVESSVRAQLKYDESDKDLIIWIDYAADNSATFKVKFGPNAFEGNQNLGAQNQLNAGQIQEAKVLIIESIKEFANTDINVIIEGSEYEPTVEDAAILGPKEGDEYYFGLRRDAKYDREKNFFGFTKAVFGMGAGIVNTGMIEDKVWKHDGDCLFDFTGIVIGPMNGFLENNPLAELMGLIGLAKSIAFDAKTRSAMAQALLSPGKTGAQMLSSIAGNLDGSQGKEQQLASIGHASVSLVIMVVTGGAISKFLKGLGKKPDEIASKTKKSIDDLNDATDDFHKTLDDALPTDVEVDKLLKVMGDMGPQLRKVFTKHPEFVDIYKKYLDDFPDDVDQFVRVLQSNKLPLDKLDSPFFKEFKESFVKLEDGVKVVDVDIKKFIDDVDKVEDKAFSTIMRNNQGALKAWKAIVSHPLIRKDVRTLTSVSRILDNTGITNIISRTDLQTTIEKLANKGVKCRTCPSGNPSYRYMDEILDDIEHGAVKFGDSYKSVITGFKQGGNFTEGSIFVADAVKRYGDNFTPNSIFEFTTKTTADNIRRVDSKVPNGFNGNKDIFYEFKSVQDVPPSGFSTQFVKDMDLPDVTDLNQLKWWFDGKKLSSLPKENFISALESATISQDVINKLVKTGPKTKEALIDLIDDDFDLIFSLK